MEKRRKSVESVICQHRLAAKKHSQENTNYQAMVTLPSPPKRQAYIFDHLDSFLMSPDDKKRVYTIFHTPKVRDVASKLL